MGVIAIHELVCRNAHSVYEKARDRAYSLVTPLDAEGKLSSGIVSFGIPGGRAQEIVSKLMEKNIQVAARQGIIRLSPHFYNSEEDIVILFEALDDLLA